MRALLIGAVEGTRVALDAIARASDWTLAGVATLPPALAARHSDFVDVAAPAAENGAEVLFVADVNDPGFLKQLADLAPDIVFVIGWSQLCGAAFRAAAQGRVIGYHPAPLPRLRGRAVIPWTILLDEKITASTLFWIDQGTDSGPLLAQRFFHVAPDETAASLYAKHMIALGRLLDELLPQLATGDSAAEQQDVRLATWAARRRPSDGRIDWTRPASDIERLIRAVGKPYPGAFAGDGESRLTVWAARPWQAGQRHSALPGQVIAQDPSGFAVCCGDNNAIYISEYESARGRLPALHSIVAS